MPKVSRGGKRGSGGAVQPVTPQNTTPIPDYMDPAKNPDNLPQNMFNALGQKGSEINSITASKNTNPNYQQGKQWRINCQRCIYAYEMQRRGYDVTAQPNLNNAHYSDGFDMRYSGGYRNVFQGQKWANVGGKRVKAQVTNIENQMATWGEGSRAAVMVVWKRGNSGHVFNVEQKNGKLLAVDAQRGKKIDISRYIGDSKLKYTQISRIDNLTTPTDNLLKCITKRS